MVKTVKDKLLRIDLWNPLTATLFKGTQWEKNYADAISDLPETVLMMTFDDKDHRPVCVACLFWSVFKREFGEGPSARVKELWDKQNELGLKRPSWAQPL